MMRSMFAGISGLRSHQTMMDVVGNNIANVNTAGYKASMVTFQEALTQQLRGASGAAGDRGGINPLQIGLGTQVASIDGIFTQGASQVTGRATDMAIQGDGFFIVSKGGEHLYTRAGSFNFDEVGNLVSPLGLKVMGWMADASGAIDASTPIETIQLPLTQVIDPQATTVVEIGGNLSASLSVGERATTSITIFDSLGEDHELQLIFTKAADNSWTVAAEVNGVTATLSSTAVTFDTDGSLTSAGGKTWAFFGTDSTSLPDLVRDIRSPSRATNP